MASLNRAKERAEEEVRRRKVSPIYSALDSQQWKQALKLCDKKDMSDWDIVLVLKAHALVKMERTDEARAICHTVKARCSVDDSVLSTLALNYKLMDMPDDATECYENALSKQPGNMEMAQEVFFSHVRRFNFAKQQQFAIKLNKQVPSLHFMFWSATAALLQARKGGAGPMVLLLAEKMVKRCLDTKADKGGVASAEEFRLFVALLREQGKTQDALDFVVAFAKSTPPLGMSEVSSKASLIYDETSLQKTGVPSEFLMLQPAERLELEAELRLALGDAESAHSCYAALAAFAPDQWSYHQGGLTALFSGQGVDTAAAGAAGAAEALGTGAAGAVGAAPVWVGRRAALEAARGKCWELQAGAAGKSRGPWLAELELLHRHADASGAADLPAAWAASGAAAGAGAAATSSVSYPDEACRLAVAYLDRFGGKLCCFLDLRPHLRRLVAAGRREDLLAAVADRLAVTEAAACDDAGGGGAASDAESAAKKKDRVDALHAHVTLTQCRRFLRGGPCHDHGGGGGDVDVGALQAEARRLFKVYNATLDLNVGATGGQREVQHGDELLLLAAHALRDAYDHLERTAGGGGGASAFALRLRLDAAVVCEYGRLQSPFNYHLKLFLLEAYGGLGAGLEASKLFKDLRVKNVQLDSLSYLLLPAVEASGLFAEQLKQSKAIARFHRGALRDAGDFAAKALECGNYSRAAELVEFQAKRMDLSATRVEARADAANLELLLSCHGLGDARNHLAAWASGALPDASPVAVGSLMGGSGAGLQLSANADLSVRPNFDDAPEPTAAGMAAAAAARVARKEAVLRLLAARIAASPKAPAAAGGVSGDAAAAPPAAAAAAVAAAEAEAEAEAAVVAALAVLSGGAAADASAGDGAAEEAGRGLGASSSPMAAKAAALCALVAEALAPCSGASAIVALAQGTRAAAVALAALPTVHGGGGPVSSTWLEAASSFLAVGGACLPLGAMALLEARCAHRAAEGKKKGKKKGKEAAAAASAAEVGGGDAAAAEAAKDAHVAVLELLASLRAAVSVAAAAASEATLAAAWGGGGGGAAAGATFPDLIDAAFDEARGAVFRGVAASHGASAESLASLLDAKVAAMEAQRTTLGY